MSEGWRKDAKEMKQLIFLAILLFTPIIGYTAPIYLDCKVKETYSGPKGENSIQEGIVNIKIDDGYIDTFSDTNLILFARVTINEDSFVSSHKYTAKDGAKHSTELEISRVSGKLITYGTVYYPKGDKSFYRYSGSCNKVSGTKF